VVDGGGQGAWAGRLNVGRWVRPEFAALVSPGAGRDEKGSPIDAPSIHIGALVAPWTRAFMAWTLKLCLRSNPVLGRFRSLHQS